MTARLDRWIVAIGIVAAYVVLPELAGRWTLAGAGVIVCGWLIVVGMTVAARR